MLNNWLAFTLRNRGWVISGFACAVVFGTLKLLHLPIDAVPDVTNTQVVISTLTGAMEPERIELQVTYPIETEVSGIANVEDIRSLTKYGLSQVTVVFKEGVDIYWARAQVAEKLSTFTSKLPQGVAPELAPMTTGLGEVFMYELVASEGSALAKQSEQDRLLTLRTIQDYRVRPALRRVPGVADVDSNGGYKRQIHINVIPNKLERTGLTMEQLVARLESLGERYGGGYIEREGRQWIVRTDSGLATLEQISQAPLGLDVAGKAIRVSDIGNVRSDPMLRVGSATASGRQTVLGTVLMRNGSNSREVAKQSEECLRSLSLPQGVIARPLYTRSYLVEKTIATVSRNLIEGALLVVLILFLFLGEVRPALLVSLAIPVSLAIAASGMNWLGLSANLMSLGAIDFGLVVDGAVVMIENTVRRLKHTQEATSEIVLAATREVIQPVVFGVTVILIVYLPILALEGTEGKLFRPMALTVILVLAASLATAITLIPALATYFLHRESSKKSKFAIVEPLERAFARFFDKAIARPRVVYGCAGTLALVAVILFHRMGADFVPNLDEGDLVLNVMREPGTSIEQATQLQTALETKLAKISEVERVFSRIGTPESATDPMGPHLADAFVILKKGNLTRPRSEIYSEIEKVASAAEPGTEISSTQPIQMRFNELLEGSRADVSLRMIGKDLSELVETQTQALAALSGMPGLANLSEDPLTSLRRSPVLAVNFIPEKLARYGISLKAASDALEIAMAGKGIGSFSEDGVRYPVVVHLDESIRNDLSTLKDLPLSHPAGGTIALSKVADIESKDQVTTIARSWGRRYAALSMQVRGRDLASFVQDAAGRIAQKVRLPEDVELHWGGQFKNLQRARERMGVLIPLTLLAVFALLVRLFGNLTAAAVVFSSVPLAGIGGVFALSLRSMNLSVAAGVGFIALIGIAVLNGSVLVSLFEELRTSGEPLDESVRRATQMRFRPVMMTALVAILGFVPMALGQGIGSEVQRPLATVVIGGLFSSTALTLLVIPMAYLKAEKFKRSRVKRRPLTHRAA